MALINYPNEFRQELQEDTVLRYSFRDIVYTMKMQ